MPDNQAITAYFPPIYGIIDCSQCEISSSCWCRFKYQRDRRDFSHTSGRCPRLPNYRGFVEKEHQKLYAQTFPLIHAEQTEDTLYLTLMIPGSKRPRKVYQAKSGSWYFREKSEDGTYGKRILTFEAYHSKGEISAYMKAIHADYCLFRAEIQDYYV